MHGTPVKISWSRRLSRKPKPPNFMRLLQILSSANNICLRRLDAFRIDPVDREGISVCSF